MKNALLTFVFWSLLIAALDAQQKHELILGDKAFLLDGKPFQMISGEMHYPRIPPQEWRHRMKMAKAMGLNTIGTYVFWNVHEPVPGRYNFSGNNDIVGFIKAAKEEGLWVVLRPSPYVCAEWEFGGYPWWLLKDSTVKVRSNDPQFVNAYTKYIKNLSKQLVPHLITQGGNVLLVQLENEYGSYSNDKAYLDLNRKIFREAGFDCLLYTCDGADKISNGYLAGFLPAVNGSEDTTEIKRIVNKYHDDKGPYYLAEWYPGWFDQWGKRHAKTSAEANAKKLDEILRAGISVNIYMFHGGTTRGFFNGANMNVKEPYAPQTSSYDYDAPLDEAGNPMDKYFRFQEVIKRYLPADKILPEVPAKKKTIAIDGITVSATANLFENLPKPVAANHPLSFEELEQAYGFVLYRTAIPAAQQAWLHIQKLRDFATVYINGKRVGMLDRRLNQDSLLLSNIPKNAILDILVENNGRINYGPYLIDNRKGILSNVVLDGATLVDWKMYPLPFEQMSDLKFASSNGKPINKHPAFYKASFLVSEPGDTYLDLSACGKGFVFLNGQNLGKYWQIGPQQTIYIPGCWLKKGVNELIVFDALKESHAVFNTVKNPVLNKVHPNIQ